MNVGKHSFRCIYQKCIFSMTIAPFHSYISPKLRNPTAATAANPRVKTVLDKRIPMQQLKQSMHKPSDPKHT